MSSDSFQPGCPPDPNPINAYYSTDEAATIACCSSSSTITTSSPPVDIPLSWPPDVKSSLDWIRDLLALLSLDGIFWHCFSLKISFLSAPDLSRDLDAFPSIINSFITMYGLMIYALSNRFYPFSKLLFWRIRSAWIQYLDDILCNKN